jgi:hypothetical protein
VWEDNQANVQALKKKLEKSFTLEARRSCLLYYVSSRSVKADLGELAKIARDRGQSQPCFLTAPCCMLRRNPDSILAYRQNQFLESQFSAQCTFESFKTAPVLTSSLI